MAAGGPRICAPSQIRQMGQMVELHGALQLMTAGEAASFCPVSARILTRATR